MKHLAIFNQPFLDLLLDGKKTIESRFGKVRCAPHGRIAPGDVVLCKLSGGGILGEFVAGEVLSFEHVDGAALEGISRRYGKRICADVDPDFWRTRREKPYVTLIRVTAPRRYDRPVPFKKKGRSGWVVLSTGLNKNPLAPPPARRARGSR